MTDFEKERAKYIHVYANLPNYAMGAARKRDAIQDLLWGRQFGCETFFDIGCGRGEMLDEAHKCGYGITAGAEIVPELCDGDKVTEMAVRDLHKVADGAYDLVASFDVIEHLPRPDDELLIVEMSRIAKNAMVWTANNRPSVDPTTQNDLHINKREYADWDALFREWLEPDWLITWRKDHEYVSETWRAIRR